MMEIDFLRHFGFKTEHIDLLRAAYGKNLLPLQERVIREGHLFDGNSLVVCAPTSSGKTFLAEILFLFHALRGKNAVLLVPSKALANQRYQQWRKRYEPLGYRIVLSTRDHPFDDRKILEGRFHLAVVIYEKMQSLLAQSDAFLATLGACIIDELHYVYQPDRGPDLEILLTKLREELALQLMGLSALVSDESVADWLGGRLLIDEQRPVELRQGILCCGRFAYQEFNSRREGVEIYPLSATEDEGEAMLEAAIYFAANGETTLLFWPSRDLCYSAARKLAQRYEADFSGFQRRMDQLDPTSIRDFLSTLLASRVAVHTSDLTASERALVEQLVLEGEIVLICATPTLAEGINFPVTNVLTTHRTYTTRLDDTQKIHSTAPVPMNQDQLFNMIGRAGRLGLSECGRGMIVTTSPGDVDGLMAMYLRSKPQSRTPMLSKVKLPETILKLHSESNGSTLDSLLDFLERTLSGKMRYFAEPLDRRITESVDLLRREGFLSEEEGRYHTTPLGGLVMKHGLSIATAKRLQHYAIQFLSDTSSPLDLYVLLCLTEEMANFYISMPRTDILNHTWSRMLAQQAEATENGICPLLTQLLANVSELRSIHHAAFKKALLLFAWIGGGEILTLEKHYRIYCGALLRLSEEASWLLGCLAEIAAAHGREEEILRRLFSLRERTLYGLPATGLEWAPYLKQRDLTRHVVLKFMEMGYKSPSRIHAADEDVFKSWIPHPVWETILKDRPYDSEDNRLSYDYVLEINPAQPDQMTINGAVIHLTVIQFAMIHALAKTPNQCIPYERLLNEIWPDSVGDKKQLSKQKTLIQQKINSAVGKSQTDLMKTSAGIGMTLQAKVVRK
jgi:helicase